jgi:8-oxo-dGTP diphosphatase
MSDDKRPTLTVDVIIPNGKGEVLIIQRGHGPFKGKWCLVGGKVDNGETVEEAAVREVREEVGLNVSIERVAGVYSSPGRDPRGHFISITLLARPVSDRPRTSQEARAWDWADPGEAREMAFDHARILTDHAGRSSSKPVLA